MFQCIKNVASFDGTRKNDDRYFGMFLTHDGQARKAIHPRHVQIKDCQFDVRFAVNDGKCLCEILRLRDFYFRRCEF